MGAFIVGGHTIGLFEQAKALIRVGSVMTCLCRASAVVNCHNVTPYI
jgi:hypothetical protein